MNEEILLPTVHDLRLGSVGTRTGSSAKGKVNF